MGVFFCKLQLKAVLQCDDSIVHALVLAVRGKIPVAHELEAVTGLGVLQALLELRTLQHLDAVGIQVILEIRVVGDAVHVGLGEQLIIQLDLGVQAVGAADPLDRAAHLAAIGGVAVAGLEVGLAEFQAMLSDMEDGALGETIPDFHNIEFRIGGLRDAVARDEAGRLGKVRWMADELLGRSDEMCLAERLHREGRLPKRVTHCDTKVNNLLFDERDRPLCVIDLDTTMPGYVLSDFGDFIRTGANTGAEDDPELDRVGVDMEIFRSFSKGYLESAASFLTDVERETLTFGAQMLTYMQTVRFLTDYLDGDRYYKIRHPDHNWQRSKAQFRLLQSIDAHERAMRDFIAGL